MKQGNRAEVSIESGEVIGSQVNRANSANVLAAKL
jgi:hypothetical protein